MEGEEGRVPYTEDGESDEDEAVDKLRVSEDVVSRVEDSVHRGLRFTT